MKKGKKETKKRSQKDYSVACKLMVVSNVEKGLLTYGKLNQSMEFKVEVLYWYSFENMGN